MKKLMIIIAVMLLPTLVKAQGTVSYSMPQTVLVFSVEAQKETFYAGPYARYAQKYLGVSAELHDRVSYTVTSVKLFPAVEADQSVRYTYVMNGQSQPLFLQLTSQGLVSGPSGSYSGDKGWKYPAGKGTGFSGKGIPSNLTERTNTLYEADNHAVRQRVVVEKTTEDKAKEVADKIFEIRDNKYKILVGDTDATYSGEAMKATIDALNKLEQDYLALFMGFSEFGSQSATFEVIPAAKKTQTYVAFRLSDEDGLVPADNVSGKPYFVQLNVEDVAAAPPVEGKAKPVQVVHYRIPAVCGVRLTDGISTLLQTRVPIYQLGIVAAYPVYKTK
ncbi:MAG: DUF4831 family protein [Bacteroidales bacterium]|nr:DUF4831 family protein [Bacteroidales bacterium]